MKEKMSGRGVFGRAKEPGRRGGGKLQAVLVPHRPQSKVNFIRGRGALGVCYPGQVQLRRGLGGKLLIATTPRPPASSPIAASQGQGCQVSWRFRCSSRRPKAPIGRPDPRGFCHVAASEPAGSAAKDTGTCSSHLL